MTKNLLLVLICGVFSGYSQQSHSGIVVAANGKEPLEFVSVFNRTDDTATNEDGRFNFSSKLDSVFFYSPGYEKLETTFSTLRDTIYLQKNIVNLDEVVVTNAKTILQRIKDSIHRNYLLTPHTETFFIRALLRRNDTIVRLQDMQGKVKRKTSLYTGDLELYKNDYEVEVLQMRQVGIKNDQNNVYFIFPSFFRIFSEFVRINAMGPDFEVTENPLENTNDINVTFTYGDGKNTGLQYGEYLINENDNAILSFNVTVVPILPESKKNETQYDRTTRLESATFFKKETSSDRYYINYAKQKATISTKRKEHSKATVFEIELILHTTNPFTSANVNSNVNEHKDIFKLKIPYNEAYWQAQNQLLLTDEMLEFLARLNDDNTEFKIRTNLD
jgi:hypothetical protein